MMEDPGWHSGPGQTAMGQGVGKMGDRIIAHDGATFINRSYVKDAFNRLKGDVGDDVANALMSVVQKIEQSNNKSAGAIFDQLTASKLTSLFS
jgi:hypothetical protein